MSTPTLLQKIEDLVKALELGSQNAMPGNLVQGSALQVEDCSAVMHNVTFSDQHIKLQKEVKVSKAKGQLFQFNRQLSYGTLGGSAQPEGQVGQEETSDFVRSIVPMAYYSHIRRVTVQATMAETQDGVKAEDREAKSATMKIAADVEMDLFRGCDDFSNAGVFDGNPLAVPDKIGNMRGLGLQIRQSDNNVATQDLMFDAFGSGLSVVIAGGGILTQSMLEDAWVRGVMNFGSADRMFVDPLVLSAYSKNSYATKERIMLGNSVNEPVTGADIRRQAVSGGVVNVEASRFLSGQFKPQRSRSTAPAAPTHSSAQSAGSTTFAATEVYFYSVTSVNEFGESLASAPASITISTLGNQVAVTITPADTTQVRSFKVYRTLAGGAAASARLVGAVKNSGAATTVFTDLNNRKPGAISGFLTQLDTMEVKELSPYSRLKLAVADLTIPEAHFRFLCLAVYEPRKNVIVDNLIGAL